MSLFRSAFSRDDSGGEVRSGQLPTNFNDWLRLRLGGASASLEMSGHSQHALGHPVVYRSVSKVSGIVAQLPWTVIDDGRPVDRLPALLRSPSPGVVRASAWKRAASSSMLLGGGVYGWVTVEGAGPVRVDLIHPECVDWSSEDGWSVNGNPVEEWPSGPFWQVPLQTLPGSPKGLNPLEYARRTTFAGLASAEFGSNFFRDGGHPTSLLAPEKDPGQEGAEALKQRFVQATAGGNREPMVLPQSVKYQQLQVNPSDSQFIETMKFTGAELAGFFGLMPEHVGLPADGGGMDYSNRENRQQDLLQDAVMPVLLPLEEALGELLDDGLSVKFNVAGLLRPDLKARYDSYKVAADIGAVTGETFLSVAEMRALEDRDPLDGDVAGDSGAMTARQLAEALQKIYLSVGVVISADEAREILNREGAGLTGAFTQKKKVGE